MYPTFLQLSACGILCNRFNLPVDPDVFTGFKWATISSAIVCI